MIYTVVGTQWGDEGKGKLVDWLSSKAQLVVRFQGGNNAGHTIQIKNKTFKLNLLPSGIIRGKKCIIGNGVILDPWSLQDEVKKLNSQGIKINSSNLSIAENICLILPIHKIVDQLNENLRGKDSIGTTKKGIGPAYEDKVGRRAIRLCDLDDEKMLKHKIKNILNFHSLRFKANKIKINSNKLFKELIEINKFIKKFSKPSWKQINEIDDKNKMILFEGAQGSLLDLDYGTYPYVTSSNTLSGQIFAGTGFANRKNHKILGITKAYTTRVGNGPFPTELNDSIGDHLGIVGKEFGTVTKRKRRCGWFDANLVKQTAKLNGLTDIILTKLDVLDGLKNIKICVGYNIKNKKYNFLPSSESLQEKIQPIYKTLQGWDVSTFGKTKWSDLPNNAKKYILFIEKIVGVKISIISTGPERSQTIIKKKII